MNKNRKERRKYPRLKRNLIVGFRKMDSMERYENGTTDNIGMGGFRVDVAFLGKPLTVNQVIEITMKGPREKAEPIGAIGRVAWLRQKEDKHGYEIGVMLTCIKKQDRQRYLKYISEKVGERTLM